MAVEVEVRSLPDASPEVVLGLVATRRRTSSWVGGLVVGLLATMVAAIAIGAVSVPAGTVAQVVTHHLTGWPGERTWSAPLDAIVWQVRMPRVLLGVLVGAGLAICGVALQAMVRNVLADPYLLGVNSGASSGAAAAILFGVGAGFAEHALQVTAFLGALAASLLVFLIARSGGRVTSVRMLLAGVAVGYALYALTSFLIFASGSAEGARSVMFWLLGSLGLAQWDLPFAVVAVVVLGSAGLLTLWGRRLDALAVGDETAHTLGVSTGPVPPPAAGRRRAVRRRRGLGRRQHRVRRTRRAPPRPPRRRWRTRPRGRRRRPDGRCPARLGRCPRPHALRAAGGPDRDHHLPRSARPFLLVLIRRLHATTA